MNDIEKYFSTKANRPIHKWNHYFDIYDFHFSKFRNKKINLLEIGINGGGSLQMWKWYFGTKAKIFGVDIDEGKLFKEARIKTYQCDQGDHLQLFDLLNRLPKMDIVIDDGGHTMDQQLTTFQVAYPLLSENGIYLCEDTHTSLFPEYGGGIDRKRTFVGVMKKHIDQLNSYHSRGTVDATEFTAMTKSIHFYDSIVVIEKGVHVPPEKLSARVRKEEETEDKE